MRKILLSLILFFASIIPLSAKISFGNPSINKNDEVLFTINQQMPGVYPYNTLFYVKLKDGSAEKNPAPLTVFPEQMELLDNGTVLQIRNRYGIARYSSITEKLEWVNFSEKLPVNALPTSPYSASPDGKYICKIEKNGICSGSLVIQNIYSNKSVIVCDSVLNSYEDVPVKWSADSSVLLYENNGVVYFCNPEAVLRGVEVDEKYRKIGRGTINSVCWTSSKYLAYVDDCILYKINSKELYTLGLYSGIIGQGTAMGRLPFRFNSQTDRFYTNDAVNAIVVVQNDKIFSYLKSQSTTLDYLDVIYSRPYTDSQASLVDTYVFWNNAGQPVLWQRKLPYNGANEQGAVYRFDVKATRVLDIQEAGKPYLSPDGSKVAFFANKSCLVYDINSWQKIAELNGEKVSSLCWINRNALYVGGENTIKKWSLLTNTYEIVTLSSALKGCWDDDEKEIVAQVSDNLFYKYNVDKATWKTQSAQPLSKGITQNGRYRVFTASTSNNSFENALYVRMLNKKAVTKALFAQSVAKSTNTKKAALVFDAYDNTDGLAHIISSLKEYNVPATFFINGEFIRRFPQETRQIVLNGYNCGSMFFSAANLMDDSFVIDEDFIRRGLARNEDEFYVTTNNELCLYWHAPYYSVSSQLIDYASKAGYSYVNSFHSINDGDLNKDLNADQLIQEYCNTLKKTGSGIVPVSLGSSLVKNARPLYDYLDLLICALLDNGFELVKVEDL